jgi:hypothetical protein
MSEDVTATLEATLTTEVARMYEEVATHPEGDYHFYTGRRAADMYGYRPEDLDAKASTQDAAEQYGVKAVVFTAQKPTA